ncbi:TetR/AcrR family transcriptional regulator [Brevibacillus laterosporus]|uniref:TetR/AcrR family transcriptional regulator n=1 Tax=Brevibacillus laterosporus TaxID=1465 RepID=A0AAP3DMI0_BRELA|nr:TetR/AcrR family transcriptional regulator [Brevibacillus laterosporus]MCR8983029.1 TetR/AcrR family transcriptional regulator [Brevibacillus laterosporus]MCZ0810185.1 TetR/AcrR family transcriptional regulator [Brevibacillus laterosporus]MCZ0828811.1 TetR/AcrR family transcriptional regulator [Brevibacillus laterosporus]MCZ0852836.1 TetR/AcrR family transcriptional regulator [Brevibacillus laterosporus]
MSTHKKEDPRSIRTKEMFKKAVLQLLSKGEKTSSLTVQKVAKAAKLNRTTFYLHYHDIQELVGQLAHEIMEGISVQILSLIDARDLSEKQQLTKLLDNLYSHREYLLILFDNDEFEEKLFIFFQQLVMKRRESSEQMLPENYVTIDIKTASLIGVIMWWIRKGLHFSSDYIANQIYLLYKG